MVMTAPTNSCTRGYLLASPTAKLLLRKIGKKLVRYKVKNERKFVMDH